MKTFIFTLLGFTFFSCSIEKSQINTSTLFPEIISSPSDPDLGVSGMLFTFQQHDSGYVVADGGMNQLVLLSSDFLPKKTFSTWGLGEGPYEFRNPPMLFSTGQHVVAIESKKAITYDLEGNALMDLSVDVPYRNGIPSEFFDPERQLYYYGANNFDFQILGLSQKFDTVFTWGSWRDNRDNGIPVSLPDGNLMRVGTNDGILLIFDFSKAVLDSFNLAASALYANEQTQIDKMLDGEWDHMGLPIAQQVKVYGDYLFIRIGTQPTDGRPTGFGANDVRKWLVLRWNPKLELIAEWEVPVEYGRLYTGFVISPDSNALIAYEAERGEFHRLPFPEGFGER